MTSNNYNPFFHRGIIRDPRYFVGRNKTLETLYEMVIDNQSCSITGPRRIGKSSLLYQLSLMLRNQKNRTVVVFADCSIFRDVSKSQFWEKLLRLIQSSVSSLEGENEILENISQIISRQNITYDVQVVADLIDNLRRYNLPVFFLFDEFEHIINNRELGPIFLGELRSLIGGIFDTAMVTATQTSLFNLTFSEDLRASPFFNIFTEIKLNLFSNNVSSELVRRILALSDHAKLFNEGDFALINYLGGNHPFFVQLAAYALYEIKNLPSNDIFTEYEINQVKDIFYANVESHFRYLWQSLNFFEKKFLQDLISANQKTQDSYLVSALKEKCILEDVEGSLKPFADSFADFIKKQEASSGSSHVTEIQESKQYELEIHYSDHHLTIRLLGDEISLVDEGSYLFEDIQSYNVRVQQLGFSQLWRKKTGYVGAALFREIITNIPSIAKSYWYARGLTGQNPNNLRLTFIGGREFIGLPIEYLRAEGEWLALQHSISRKITGIQRSKAPLSHQFVDNLSKRGECLKVLIIASNTIPHIPGVDTEINALNSLLPKLAAQFKLKVEVKIIDTEQADVNTIKKLLNGCEYHVVHYAGHGSYDEAKPEESGLYFWDAPNKNGGIIMVSAQELNSWLRNSQVRFMYFSCCYGSATGPKGLLDDGDFLGVLDSVIKAGVPSALGYRWPASDRGALDLATRFYNHLFEDWSVSNALFKSRCDIADININDHTWSSPIIVMQ